MEKRALEWLEYKIQSDMTFMEVLGLIRQAKEMKLEQLIKQPKKLIREKIIYKIQPEEWGLVEEKGDLYKLYDLKVREELNEIIQSERKDIMEFGDLLQVVFDYAKQSGFNRKELMKAVSEKAKVKGRFSNIALINLNPNNPSNKLYF